MLMLVFSHPHLFTNRAHQQSMEHTCKILFQNCEIFTQKKSRASVSSFLTEHLSSTLIHTIDDSFCSQTISGLSLSNITALLLWNDIKFKRNAKKKIKSERKLLVWSISMDDKKTTTKKQVDLNGVSVWMKTLSYTVINVKIAFILKCTFVCWTALFKLFTVGVFSCSLSVNLVAFLTSFWK